MRIGSQEKEDLIFYSLCKSDKERETRISLIERSVDGVTSMRSMICRKRRVFFPPINKDCRYDLNVSFLERALVRRRDSDYEENVLFRSEEMQIWK